MGKLVNKRDLSEIIGVSERTFTEWQKEPGFPFEINGGRGVGNSYDTAKVIQWMIERDIARRSAEKPRDRLDRLKADMVEVDLAERLGQLAPAALFERAWSDHIIAAKTELLSLPLRLVGEIHALHNITVDTDLILVQIEASLAKLESFDVDAFDSDEPDPEGDDAPDGGDDD